MDRGYEALREALLSAGAVPEAAAAELSSTSHLRRVELGLSLIRWMCGLIILAMLAILFLQADTLSTLVDLMRGL